MRREERRLVWADELLERGDRRGELITTQCALERGGLGREDSIRLRRRELELLEQIAEDLDEVTIGTDEFLQNRASIFENSPLLRRLRLLDTDRLDEVLEDDRIDGLELRGVTLGMAMRMEGLRNLDELALSNLTEPFLERNNEPTRLRPRRLRLQSHSQQKQTIELESLAHEDFFSRLEDLELEWFVRPNVFVRGSSALLRRLRRLRLPMGIASAPLSLAANPEDLDRLEELSISFFGNEDEIDFGPLVTGEYFRKLRVLRIGPGLSTNDTVRALLRSPLARTLEVLDLRKNRWHLDLDVDWDGIVLT